MVDVSKMIEPKSDQTNSEDLLAGPRTITVTAVRGNDNADQPLSIFYEGDNGRPFKPSKSMRRVLVRVWGNEGDAYVGRSMTLYCDPEVKFGGVKVGGIRISHMSHIDRPQKMMLTKTRGKKAEYTVRPLSQDPREQALSLAKEAADQGKDAFTAFWNSAEGKEHREYLTTHLDELKAIVARAGERGPSVAERMQQAKDTPDAAPEPAEDVSDGHWTDEVDTKEAFPGDELFDEGMKAHAEDMARTDCPHSDHTMAAQWLGGWDQAEKQKQEVTDG